MRCMNVRQFPADMGPVFCSKCSVRTSENYTEFLFIRARTRNSKITNNIDEVTPHGIGIFQSFFILFS